MNERQIYKGMIEYLIILFHSLGLNIYIYIMLKLKIEIRSTYEIN